MTTTKDLIEQNGKTGTITPPAAPNATVDKRDSWSIDTTVVIPDLIEGAVAEYIMVPIRKDAVMRYAVKDVGTLEMPVAKLHESNLTRALFHGLKQRVPDGAALPRGKDGKPAPRADKFAGMRRLVEHYVSGADSWSPARAEGSGGGGAAGAVVALLVEALKRMNAAAHAAQPEKVPVRTEDYLRAKVTGWTATERAAMLTEATLKPHVDAIREELAKAAAAQVDTAKLLSDI